MSVRRQGLKFALFVVCGLAAATQAFAFEPSRPVEVVVHSAPGGGSDVFAKELIKIVEKEKLLAQPLQIVNKTKGASIEAMEYLVEKRGADHTIAIFTNTWVATPLTAKDAKLTVKDLTPVVRLVLEPTIAVVRGDTAYKTLADFVAAAKKEPGKLKQAGGSTTAIESLTGLLVQSATGAKWTFIPTPAIKDRIGGLLDGTVDIIVPQPQDVNEHIQSGRMRPVAAFTEKRLAILPNVPTVKEQGIDMPIIANARGFLAPPGVAPDVVAYWEDFFARLVKTPSWRKYLEENQVEDVYLKGRELGPFFDEQIALMRNVLQLAGVSLAR
jgi:putative tricarboxylic transport membrane protein